MTATPPEDLPPFPDFCWPTDVTCVTDWDAYAVEPDEDEPGSGVPLYTEQDKAYAVSLAGQTMRMLTVYRVGGCPVTVRPTAARCRERTWRTYPVSGPGSTPWQPVSLGGQWLNIGCGHASPSCGCTGLSEVRLYGPSSAVTEVRIDGVVLDPSAYRLDPGGRLVRIDGDAWPLCQNLSAPDTEPGTWSVTYTPGAAVDGIGARAAGLLAGQFVRACTGGECDLPANVVSIARNGINITLGVGTFPEGKTGIREVDAYVERWNPYAHKAPPAVYSPDLHRPRRVAPIITP